MAKNVTEILCETEISQYNPAGRMSTSDMHVYRKLKQSTADLKWAGIAQSVERLATGKTVTGSYPGEADTFRNIPDRPWDLIHYLFSPSFKSICVLS
jgi:hypothetical protein